VTQLLINIMEQILGIKKGMTRVFKGDISVPVTIIDVEGCVVSLVDTKGVEIGIGKKKAAKALAGKYSKLGYVPQYRMWISGEFDDVKIGDSITAEMLGEGTSVAVKGKTKGKGFQGVVKRWGFAGGPKTHGQSDKHRAPGSIGAGTDPGRVLKGKKMGGKMGNDNVTLGGKEVVSIKENYVMISGSVPGNKGSIVLITKA
jgi:large subunit ribosomal protein L3